MKTSTITIASLTVAALLVGAALLLGLIVGSDEHSAASTTTNPVPAGLTTTSEPGEDPVTTTTIAPAETDLPPDLRLVTIAWPTNWALRTIDLDELKIGINANDPRDRIRPLDNPRYESIESADQWLVDREIGISFELGGVARFYPLRILTSHEIVNDSIDGVPYAVTYCPLCNTAVAFDRRVGDEVLRFGVSGLLRNSDLVMWDDQTVSLWQQITGDGIVGDFAGRQLDILPTATVTWSDFVAAHPDGEALSQDTGFGFNYGSNSYAGYSDRAAPFGTFFDGEIDDRFPALERVVGVRVDDLTKAYPFSVLAEDRTVDDELGGVPIAVWWAPTDAADSFDGRNVGEGRSIGTGIAFLADVDGQRLTFTAADDNTFVDDQTGSRWTLFGRAVGGPLEGTQLELALHQNEFWFAWSAFNQDAHVHGSN